MSQVLKSKYEQFLRLLFVRYLTPKNDSVILVEFPKSGGTWLGQLVSSYLEIPFPRNQKPSIKKSLYHSHYLPTKKLLKNKKIIFLVRDGRDVMISMYFHQLIWNDKNRLNPKDVHYHRKNVSFNKFEDVSNNIGSFIEYAFTHKPSKLKHYTYMGNWASYNQAWLRIKEDINDVYLIKYEDLLENTYSSMKKMLEEFFYLEVDENRLNSITQQYSFENQTKRKKGEEQSSSFLRKGVQGDWKNYFSEKDKELFKKFGGQTLIDLGYEQNENW